MRDEEKDSKVLIVSHSVFGQVLTKLNDGVGIHLANCEMVPIDEYITSN